MKKFLTLTVLLLIAFQGFSQTTNPAGYDELMQKSRRARTVSTIMVATGPVIAAGGVGTLIYGLLQNEIEEPGYYYDANGNYVETPAKKHTTEIIIGAAATVVGLGVALGSIAFSSRASDLRSKARKLKFKPTVDRLTIPGLPNSFANSQTRLYKMSLLIRLGK